MAERPLSRDALQSLSADSPCPSRLASPALVGLITPLAHPSGVFQPPPVYQPPVKVPNLALRELRRTYRKWLTTNSLNYGLEARTVPQAFCPNAGSAPFVLEPIQPLNYFKREIPATIGGGGSKRTPKVTVERHKVSHAVVAQKMLKRMQDDVAWLAQQVLRERAVPPSPALRLHQMRYGADVPRLTWSYCFGRIRRAISYGAPV